MRNTSQIPAAFFPSHNARGESAPAASLTPAQAPKRIFWANNRRVKSDRAAIRCALRSDLRINLFDANFTG